jgi:hypothetical protein
MPRLALLVAVAAVPDEAAGQSLSPPFEDPPDATERSCGLAAQALGQRAHPWLLLLAAAGLSLRRRLQGFTPRR